MITKLVLDRLDIFYDDIAKKKHGSCKEITYGELISRIVAARGTESCHTTFGEIGAQTFNRLIQKVFPGVKLNGGNETWFFYLCTYVEHKHCRVCDRILPFSSFHKDKNASSLGINSNCKECISESQKGAYAKYITTHQASYTRNYGKIRERQNRYKGERSLRVPSWSETELIAQFYEECPEGYHVDHIIPLKGDLVSGLHVIANLQYLLSHDNLAKGNKFEIE